MGTDSLIMSSVPLENEPNYGLITIIGWLTVNTAFLYEIEENITPTMG